jgi:hypothetical protein
VSRMAPRDNTELGTQVRQSLWRFSSTTALRGTQRARAGAAFVRSHFPATRGVFTDGQLAAVLQEPPAGRCSWDNLEALPDKPTPELVGLLGRPCAHCRVRFETGRVARREAGMLAAAAQHPPTAATGYLWPAGQEPEAMVAAARAAARRTDPPYYRPGRSR